MKNPIMRPSERGVSLIEALVALAVMAVGAVALVGMQAGLRMNADVAKQRAGAVRLAQEVLEDWRGFTSFTAAAGATDWTDMITSSTTQTPAGSNTSYTRAVTVVDSGVTDDNPRAKTVHVRVGWSDRTGTSQWVDMNSLIVGAHPAFAGTAGVPMLTSLLSTPGGRHAAVPPGAVDNHDGTSSFSPPGGGSVIWKFSNVTGEITHLCASAGSCTAQRALLLSGFVRFETDATQPTGADAEAPDSAPLATLTVTVDEQDPANGTITCYQSFASTYIAYFCAMPIRTEDPARWTGVVQMTGVSLATSIADTTSTRYKVCRYTAVRDNNMVVPTNLKNTEGPLRYVDVGQSLTDQNFLVIRAGNAGTPFVCPNDDTSTTNVNGSTWYHQPST